MEPRENDINDTRRSLSIVAYLIFTAVILLPLIFKRIKVFKQINKIKIYNNKKI